jgi:GntR family transcriptional regulator, transcriptional repressor for pyruvate dehydrogenase complex
MALDSDASPAMRLDAIEGARGPSVRTPKTAELVAQRLRRIIVSGELKDGDFLPNETELMAHFGVSRPTLREGIRVLESDRLVEVRRGSRTGARVRVPGPETVARPAGLILEVSGATIGDVLVARSGIEPLAARLLAEQGDSAGVDELESLLDQAIPAGFESGRLAEATAHFHRRMVELSGNKTLSLIAGMLHEITERHTAEAISRKRKVTPAHYQKLVRSYQRLIDLLRSGEADKAEAHWRRHLDTSRELTLLGQESVKVRDIMG